ncbi:MAG: hypothetical protein ABIH66_01240 [bacterium]
MKKQTGTEANGPNLLVVDGGKIVGVVREQDLFFEIANVIGHLDV